MEACWNSTCVFYPECCHDLCSEPSITGDDHLHTLDEHPKRRKPKNRTARKARMIKIVRKLEARTPPFLFRDWHSDSGGDEHANTVDAITPTAFLETSTEDPFPDDTHGIPFKRLSRVIDKHFWTIPAHTPFSSWSQYIVGAEGHACSDFIETAHLSVIDTRRLPAHNRIALTSEWHKIFHTPSNRMSDSKYMVYAPIRGDAHASVSLRDLNKAGMGYLMEVDQYNLYFVEPEAVLVGDRFEHQEPRSIAECQKPQSLGDEVEIAKTIGKLYGGDFALPVAIYMICQRARDAITIRGIVEALSDQPIPDAWSFDGTILADDTVHLKHPDVQQSAAVMRALLEKRSARDDRENWSPKYNQKTHRPRMKSSRRSRARDCLESLPRLAMDMAAQNDGGENNGLTYGTDESSLLRIGGYRAPEALFEWNRKFGLNIYDVLKTD